MPFLVYFHHLILFDDLSHNLTDPYLLRNKMQYAMHKTPEKSHHIKLKVIAGKRAILGINLPDFVYNVKRRDHDL